MSRLTELIRQAKQKAPAHGAELEREYRTLSGRRGCGLNFERQGSEAVELPTTRQPRPARDAVAGLGDTLRVLGLTESSVRAAVATATDAASLYQGPHATDH